MEMTTAIPYALFLLACFGLAWSAFYTVAKAAIFIAKAACNEQCNVSFMPQIWTGCISFTAIMGYIFIL